jgi:hypothetical protein
MFYSNAEEKEERPVIVSGGELQGGPAAFSPAFGKGKRKMQVKERCGITVVAICLLVARSYL